MRVLIDTNVVLDALLGREPYFGNADYILKLCADKKIEGYIAAHSVSDMFYILRKDMSEEHRREVLLNVCEILEILGINSAIVKTALHNKEFRDLEDCLQDECAQSVGAEYIVTRNIKDYSVSKIPAVLPADFLKLLDK